MKIKGKAALVTGAGAGIGRAIAIRFAAEGASVMVADIDRPPASSRETVALIERAGGRAAAVTGDVSKAADAERMVGATVEAFGALDILVNNAGIFMAKRLAETSEQDWNALMDVNINGVFLCSRYAIPVMVSRGGGTIVNMSSVAGLAGYPLATAYCASKAAVLLMTKALSAELASSGIRVNALCPTIINTDMGRQVARAYRAAGVAGIDLKSAPTPDEVASSALFLASDDSAPTTGHGLVLGPAGSL
ncbi:MAG: SDR family oxidoreductase [Actinobacteria bacterium]|nr:SDR family oxidoreductase [Actinomycetota bacterium]